MIPNPLVGGTYSQTPSISSLVDFASDAVESALLFEPELQLVKVKNNPTVKISVRADKTFLFMLF